MKRLYQTRLAEAERAARRVTVEFQFNGTFFEWLISDEGEGFDWNAIPNPLEENRILNSCGRGIFLSRLIFDEMEYQGKGNAVRIRKYLKKPETAEKVAEEESKV